MQNLKVRLELALSLIFWDDKWEFEIFVTIKYDYIILKKILNLVKLKKMKFILINPYESYLFEQTDLEKGGDANFVDCKKMKNNK